MCERERESESELLSVEKEDEESKGSNSLVEQVSHGHKGEGAIEEKPSRMEIPPARSPEIHRFQRIASATPLPEESDGDRRREHEYKRANQYLPLQPVFNSLHRCFVAGILHFYFLFLLAAV